MTQPNKRQHMYLRELEERASLLVRLGYSKVDTRRRLRGNVLWDFELHKKPAFLSQIDGIVEAVYKRGRSARGGPPTLE